MLCNVHSPIAAPPKLTQPEVPPRTSVIEGEQVTIRCPVDAFPLPYIDWLKASIFELQSAMDLVTLAKEVVMCKG